MDLKIGEDVRSIWVGGLGSLRPSQVLGPSFKEEKIRIRKGQDGRHGFLMINRLVDVANGGNQHGKKIEWDNFNN